MDLDRVSLRWITWVAIVLVPQAIACGAEHDGSPGTLRSPALEADAGTMPQSAVTERFPEVYALLEMRCGGGKSGCHLTGASAGLAMPDAHAAFAQLVSVASTKCAGEMRVVPGDADSSVLVQALEGRATCVKAMPLGRDALSASEIAMIRAWIDDGAAED
jgi:hypothetical protein